jgi:predicted amidohydrolase YtcJ
MADKERADSILFGEVVLLDGKGTRAEALAFKDGHVLALGRRDDILALKGERTEVHDFGPAAIVPGFNDTHAHMDTEGLKLARPSLSGARFVADVLARIRQLASGRPPGSWVVTMPIGEPPFYFGGPEVLAEKRMPTRQELDQAAPNHPVCILPPSGYWGVPPCYLALNTRGLELNRIDRNTRPRLPGVEIVRDAAGEPTGVFIDRNPRESAQLDLMPAVPRYTYDERRQGVRDAIRLYQTKGTTSVYEGHGCSPEVIEAYRELWEKGELTMRIGMVVGPPWSVAREAEPVMRDWLGYARGKGLGDDRFRISGIHLGWGGDPVAVGLAREQANDTGYWSHLWQASDPKEFEAQAMLAARHGLRVHVIASMGRQREILPILERVDREFGIKDRRWVLEHVSLSKPEDLQTIKRLGLGVTLIPTHHLWKNGASFLDLPQGEQDYVVPARHLLALGVPVAAGTDNTPFDPLSVARVLMLREERTTGRVVGSGGRLDAEAALGLMTWGGAWFTFEEGRKGRLLPGHYADCAVLSRNPLDVDAREYDGIACLATVVGGQFVYRS